MALIEREPAKTVQIERAALVPVSAPFKLARVSFVSEAAFGSVISGHPKRYRKSER